MFSVLWALGPVACDSMPSDDDDGAHDGQSDSDSGATGTGSGSDPPSTEPPAEGLPDLIPEDVVAWAEEGAYETWSSESEPHASSGPHPGLVKTFVNPILEQSLSDGAPTHPKGAAAVKELYPEGGGDLVGWSIAIKADEESADGSGWYWLNHNGGETNPAGFGIEGCVDCHGAGTDFFMSVFPLE